MTLITPSYWLKGLVEQSFLKDYPVEVRHNTVDRSVFKPTTSDFRERNGVGNRFMILGVASPWTERKGLSTFARLARVLDSDKFAIVLIGLSKKQIRRLRGKVIAFPRMESVEDLAKVYTAADVFVHPGVEETFGMTVAEARCCETSVIVTKGSACVEAADPASVRLVSPDLSDLEDAIFDLMGNSSISA